MAYLWWPFDNRFHAPGHTELERSTITLEFNRQEHIADRTIPSTSIRYQSSIALVWFAIVLFSTLALQLYNVYAIWLHWCQPAGDFACIHMSLLFWTSPNNLFCIEWNLITFVYLRPRSLRSRAWAKFSVEFGNVLNQVCVWNRSLINSLGGLGSGLWKTAYSLTISWYRNTQHVYC